MAGVRDAIRIEPGRVGLHARDVLASAEFQMMTLAERGAWFTRVLEECPPAPVQPERYVPLFEREIVAVRYGCERGETVAVKCPCGALGEVRWDGPRVRFVDMDLDHVHPVSRGGKSHAANLQLLCPRCNRSKGARVA